MTQWIKYFPCDHENLSSNPQNPQKARQTRQDVAVTLVFLW